MKESEYVWLQTLTLLRSARDILSGAIGVDSMGDNALNEIRRGISIEIRRLEDKKLVR